MPRCAVRSAQRADPCQQFKGGRRNPYAFFVFSSFHSQIFYRIGMKRGWFSWLTALMLLIALPAFADMAPVKLDVDATDAARGILHARLHIPASPGKLTLFYPKWIPGEHLPGGPINDVTGLQFSANGQPLNWRRDADDMFTFHLDVPAGADAVDVSLDFLLTARRIVFIRQFGHRPAPGLELEPGAALSDKRRRH